MINLDNTPERLKRTVSHFEGTPGLKIRRFPALRPNRTAEGLTAMSGMTPDKTLAIALSHRALATMLHNAQQHDPSMVLEDDVYPLVKDIRVAISTCLERYASKDWDIILLNTAGPGCDVQEGERPGRFCGSFAAYLLSSSGAKKLSEARISWHADLVRNSDAFNVYQGPALFGTYDLEPTGFVVGGRDILWFAKQPWFRWGKGSSVCVGVVVFLILFAIAGLGSTAALSGRGYGKSAAVVGIISATVLSVLIAIPWHTSRDSNFARCSRDSLMLFIFILSGFSILTINNLIKGVSPAGSTLCLLGSFVMIILVSLWWDERRTAARHHHPRDVNE